MIEGRTVLVLGAGASMAYGFPSGFRLKALIRRGLETGPVRKIVMDHGADKEDINRFRHELEESSELSIDEFLEQRRGYSEWGKLAIAATLLPMEKSYNLFARWLDLEVDPIIERPPDGNWYPHIYKLVKPLAELPNEKLSIITFNYDRSFEHYFFTSLRNTREPLQGDEKDTGVEECVEQMQKLPIVHVYGKLGRLEWEPGSTQQVPYGDSVAPVVWPSAVKAAADAIKIMPESRDTTPEFKLAHGLIANADRVFFLGFGFDMTNVRRLVPSKLLKHSGEFLGTGCGLSQQTLSDLHEYGLLCFTVSAGVDRRDNTGTRFPDVKVYEWLVHNHKAVL